MGFCPAFRHPSHGDNYYTDTMVCLGYDKLVYQGKVYFRANPDYMENKEIPLGWMSESWAKAHYHGVFNGTREQFVWETTDWDSLDLVLRTWKQEENVLTVKFTEKNNDHHQWTFTLNQYGVLTGIAFSVDERMESQWGIVLYGEKVIDVPRIMYASAYRESPDAVIVRDQAFYEELFTRITDGHYTTDWISHLFEALYTQPEEFARQLSRLYRTNPETVDNVLTRMGYEIQCYEPERFAQVIGDLRKVESIDKAIVDMMGAVLQTGSICTDPACTDKAHDHSGVDCTDDHCDNPTHHHSSHH